MNDKDKKAIVDLLNQIMEIEFSGVVKYSHYALMVYGYNRIPIIKWLTQNSQESLEHAHKAGEILTFLHGHPSLGIGPLLETHQHDVKNILEESLEHEKIALGLYQKLFELCKDKSVFLEEYAIEMIVEETKHVDEIDKMLRNPKDY